MVFGEWSSEGGGIYGGVQKARKDQEQEQGGVYLRWGVEKHPFKTGILLAFSGLVELHVMSCLSVWMGRRRFPTSRNEIRHGLCFGTE